LRSKNIDYAAVVIFNGCGVAEFACSLGAILRNELTIPLWFCGQQRLGTAAQRNKTSGVCEATRVAGSPDQAGFDLIFIAKPSLSQVVMAEIGGL
jgi:hypothetical protein